MQEKRNRSLCLQGRNRGSGGGFLPVTSEVDPSVLNPGCEADTVRGPYPLVLIITGEQEKEEDQDCTGQRSEK